jgi:glyoxylase-like metal-dependent hydrolase (beta-lactamase superfamily II)
MAGEDPVTHERLIELSRTVDHALATHSRPDAVAGAEQLLEVLFVHHRALRRFRERSDPITAAALETATIEMIAEVALAIGELTAGGHWPEPLLRGHVEELIDVEADCGVFGGSGRGCR